MTDIAPDERAVVVEREFPHPPEKLWRALTQPHLIEEWLMKSDFRALVDHRFEFRFDWGAVECRVLEVEQHRTLAYTWESGALRSVVTWTLTPTRRGTHLRMEQVGFPEEQPRYYQGARMGWPRFIDALEQTLATMDSGEPQ